MPYGDFDVTINAGSPQTTERMRYLNGFGTHAQQDVQAVQTDYLHGDLIRSTSLLTDQGGAAFQAASYTAFGEVIGTAPDTRYQYAGGWGYESDLLVLEGAPGTNPIALQHLGHRWYDPSIGRFIQRDPVGIRGGLNVYAYVGANPLVLVDPSGLDFEWDWRDFWVSVGQWGGGGFMIGLANGVKAGVPGGPGGMLVGGLAGGVGGALVGGVAGAGAYTCGQFAGWVYDSRSPSYGTYNPRGICTRGCHGEPEPRWPGVPDDPFGGVLWGPEEFERPVYR